LNEKDNYIIKSENSQIVYGNQKEIIYMNKVISIIEIDNSSPITIKSNKAKYDNSNHKTIFTQNVEINYLDYIIYSEELEVDFKNYLILISNNVKVKNINHNFIGDKIKVDIKKNTLEAYMNNDKEKIKIFANK